ncbi:MAG: paraquat-inducible protein A [Pseudomonadota bacterium]
MASFADALRRRFGPLLNAWRAGWGARLLLLAAVAFIPGWLVPILSSDSLGSAEQSFSVVAGIVALAQAGSLLLAVLILAFSVVFPAAKLWLLLRFALNKPLPFDPRWLLLLGKWSMLDVLVVAIIIGAGRLRLLSDFSSAAGVYWFGLAVLLSMAGAELLLKADPDQALPAIPRQKRVWLGVFSLAAALLLAVGLALPLMTVSKWIFWDNDYSLLGVLPEMVAAGEYLLPVVLGATVVAAPLLAVLALFWWCVSAQSWAQRWARALGRWSLLSVFVLALLIVMVKLGGALEVTPRAGLWFMTGGAALSMVAGFLRGRPEAVAPEPGSDT